MRKIFAVIMFSIFAANIYVYADELILRTQELPYVKFFEPKQNALIAWNGKKEFLSISFFMQASDPLTTLTVIPFPSEPKVEKADPKLFDKAVNAINRKLIVSYGPKESLEAIRALEAFGAPKEGETLPGGQVTAYKKIGVHHITTVKLLNADAFVEWAQDYFRSEKLGEPAIDESTKNIINEYIKEGYAWFVFDRVSFGEDITELEAFQYTFDTDTLYYPLKIAKTVEGETSINLIVITPNLLGKFPGISSDKIKLCNPPLGLNKEEVRDIDAKLDALFNLRFGETAEIRIWNIKGKPSEFKKDLLAK